MVDRQEIMELLNRALARETESLARCKRHYYASSALSARRREELMEHAAVRALHADLIADRVAELGGYPDFAPERAAAALQALELRGSTIAEALTEYEAQLADDTESHREMIRRIGNADVRTRAMLETIVLEEQDHLMQLAGIREELRRTDLVY